MALTPFNMPLLASTAQPMQLGTEAPAFDPITLQSMLASLPKLQQKKRRVAALRKVQENIGALEVPKSKGGYAPTVHGGLYETVPVYSGPSAGKAFMEGLLGNAAKGFAGGLAGSFGDKAEQGLEQEQNAAILNTVQQIADTRRNKGPVGGPAESTMKAYLGLIGGPDIKDMLGNQTVRSTKNLANGNLGLVTDSGIEDTGVKYDYAIEYMRNGGDLLALAKGGAARGTGTLATVGGEGGATGEQPLAGQYARNAISFDNLTPEQNTFLSDLSTKLPPEQFDQVMTMVANGPKYVGGSGEPVAPPSAAATPPVSAGPAGPARGTPIRLKTPAEEAADKVRLEAQAGAEVAPMVAGTQAQIAGAEAAAKGDVEFRQAAIAELPKMELTLEQFERDIPALINHPALGDVMGSQIWGRLENVPANKIIEDMGLAGTPQADVIARLEQMRGQVFLPAFQYIKGGGQVTDLEGNKAQAAMARMNRAQSPEDFQAAMTEFWDAYKSAYRKRQEIAQGKYSLSQFNPGGAKSGKPLTDLSDDELLNMY